MKGEDDDEDLPPGREKKQRAGFAHDRAMLQRR